MPSSGSQEKERVVIPSQNTLIDPKELTLLHFCREKKIIIYPPSKIRETESHFTQIPRTRQIFFRDLFSILREQYLPDNCLLCETYCITVQLTKLL